MSFSISGRGAIALIGCAALSLSVAACSSSGSPAAGGGSTAYTTASGAATASSTAASATSSAAADPDAGLPTGTQLKADLLSSGLPAGYALDSSGSVDTGTDYQPASSSPSGTGCANLEDTGWVDLAGQGSASFAENDYVDTGTSEEFAQEIDAFPGTTAQDVMTALSGITAKCASFKDSQTGSTVKVSVATSASPDDGAVVITLSDSAWEGPTTLEAIRVGRSVVTVLSTANSGSAAFAKSTATRIAARVAAAGNK